MYHNDIELNFINRSADAANCTIVIYQENAEMTFGGEEIAWKVIRNIGLNESFSFLYSPNVEISLSNSWGDIDQLTEALIGRAYDIVEDYSGDVLNLSNKQVNNPNAIEIWNGHEHRNFDVNCHRNVTRMGSIKSVGPGENAVFEFRESLSLVVTTQTGIEEGDVINPEFFTDLSTELSVNYITSADIVMTGGGSESNEPIQFSLENVVS